MTKWSKRGCLLFFVTLINVRNTEVSHFVRVLAGGNNSQEISQLLLLQVSFGQVLQLTLGEGKFWGAGDGQLAAILGDGDSILS